MSKLQVSLPALPFLQNQLTPIKAFLNANWDEVLEVEQADLTKVKNDLDLMVLPLSEVPIQKPEGVVITALLERAKAGESLLVKKEKLTDGKLLKLETGASVAVKTEMQKAQLLHFRPDLNISFRKISDAATAADAFIVPTAFAEYFDESHQSIPLQPEEFIPTPGAGVMALICKKDSLPQRRLLKQLHHSKTAAATNIERAIQREKDYPVAVHCIRDQANHYHVWAASFREGQLYQFKISSGTSAGLVERVCGEI